MKTRTARTRVVCKSYMFCAKGVTEHEKEGMVFPWQDGWVDLTGDMLLRCEIEAWLDEVYCSGRLGREMITCNKLQEIYMSRGGLYWATVYVETNVE